MKALIQILTLPLFATLFLMDRVVLLFVWNENSYKFKKWLYHDTLMVASVIRVFIFITVVMFLSIFIFSEL